MATSQFSEILWYICNRFLTQLKLNLFLKFHSDETMYTKTNSTYTSCKGEVPNLPNSGSKKTKAGPARSSLKI